MKKLLFIPFLALGIWLTVDSIATVDRSAPMPVLESAPVEVATKAPVEKVDPRVDARNHLRRHIAGYIMNNSERMFGLMAELIADAVIEASTDYGIPVEHLVAIIQVESSFRYWAVSKADCIGLMQINPAVWVSDADNPDNLVAAGILERRADLFHPIVNITAGAHIIAVFLADADRQGIRDRDRYAYKRYFGGSWAEAYYSRVLEAIGSFHLAGPVPVFS